MPNLRSKIFRIFLFTEHSGIWIFWRDGSEHELVLVMPNLRTNIFQNFFLYWALWTLNFFLLGVCLIINIFWSCQIWGQKFFRIFCLQSTLDSEFFFGWGCVWSSTFFGHAKFEVKNFLEFFCLQSTLDSEFFRGMGLSTNLFWSCQIWGQIFFTIFSFTKHSGLWICGGGVWSQHQLFVVIPNLTWNFLLFTECSGLWIFLGGWGLKHQLFWVIPNLKPNIFWNFFVYRVLCPLNFSGMVWNWVWLWTLNFFRTVSVQAPTFFGSCQIWGQKFFLEFFRLQKSLGSEVFGGGSKETFFGHAKYEV